MPPIKGLKKVRQIPVMVRVNVREKADIKAQARKAELSMEQYIRCKLFDIPFENVGGKPRNRQMPVPV